MSTKRRKTRLGALVSASTPSKDYEAKYNETSWILCFWQHKTGSAHALSSAWKITNIRDAPSGSLMPRPIPGEDRLATPEPEWTIPSNDYPEPEENTGHMYTQSFKTPSKTPRRTSFKGRRFQIDECYKLLTDKVDLVNPEGHQILRNVYEPLPLGGPPGKVSIQPQFFFNKDLEYLLSGDKERKTALSISKLKAARYLDFGLGKLVPSLWVKSERDYDINATYGITHWWVRRKEFYINKHREPSDRDAVRSHMRILSLICIKTYERYGYNYLREIVLR
ncbi:hypothetical protein Tco_0782042 [Tanacetum coccineum]